MKYINKKTVGAGVLGILLLLIFFSGTIYNYRLPEITGALPKNGKLSKLELSSGAAAWADVQNLYAQVGGRVEEVMVKEGDRVTQGQELLRFHYDAEETQRKLRESGNSRSRLSLDIQGIQLNVAKTERYIEELKSKDYTKEAPSTGELELKALEIAQARTQLRDLRDNQHDGDDATDKELDTARYNLQRLYLEQENLLKAQERAEETADKDRAELEASRKTKLADYQAELDAHNLELQAKNLELAGLSLQEEPYRKVLEDFADYAVLTAPAAGTITSLPVKAGETVASGALLAAMGVGTAFQVDCRLELSNNFVNAGDKVVLESASHRVEGTVSTVTPSAEGKTARVTVDSGEISAGETFDIQFKKESDTSYTLVPNGSLNKDKDGYFLLQIKRREGILGQEYYLGRTNVIIGDSDANSTAIVQGVGFFEPVVLLSDKAVTPGDVVVLRNEADFFES